MPDPADITNAARGHKAALHNPHVSEEAKEHSRQVLEKLEEMKEEMTTGGKSGERGTRRSDDRGTRKSDDRGTRKSGDRGTRRSEDDDDNDNDDDDGEPGNRSTGRSLNTSSGGTRRRSSGSTSRSRNTEGKDIANVIRGLKAAVHNPNVSEEAKKSAKERLKQLGVNLSDEEDEDEDE